MISGNKSKGLILAGVLTAVLAAFPFGRSEAQSAEMPLSELGCEKLNALPFEKMDNKQQTFARQCASDEAARAWERLYGDAAGETLVAAVVYE